MPATVSKVRPKINDITLICMCALASLKEVRGSLLINGMSGICREVVCLEKFLSLTEPFKSHLAMRTVPGGYYSEDVDMFFSRMHDLGGMSIVRDQYESDKFRVSNEAVKWFRHIVAEELRFGDKETRKLMAKAAEYLGFTHGLNQIGENIQSKINFDNHNRGNYKKCLPVLIPLACITADGELHGIGDHTLEAIREHQAGCCYCRSFFKGAGILEQIDRELLEEQSA